MNSKPMWLPIVHRELLVASRKGKLLWVRLVPALGAFLIASIASTLPTASQGMTLFVATSLLLFGYALAAGLIFTADSISSERRAGTLPILQSTGLRPFEILLGKLSSNSLYALSGFLSVLPALALPLLIGGVTGAQIGQVGLVLIGTLLLSLAFSMFASSEAETQEEALKAAATLLGLTLFLGPFVLWYYAEYHLRKKRHSSERTQKLKRIILLFCVASLLRTIITGRFVGSPLSLMILVLRGSTNIYEFWVSLCFLFALVGVFLILGSTFDDLIQRGPRRTVSLPTSLLIRLNKRARLSPHEDPLIWLLQPEDSTRRFIYGAALLLAIIQMIASFSDPRSAFHPVFNILFLFLSTPITFLIARQTSSFFSNCRENGMLEMLMVTPLSWRHLIQANKRSYHQLTNWPFANLIFATTVQLIIGLFAANKSWMLASLFMALVLWLLRIQVLFWASLYFGQRCKSALQAAAITVLLADFMVALLGYWLPYAVMEGLFNLPPAHSHILFSQGMLFVLNAIAWRFFKSGAAKSPVVTR